MNNLLKVALAGGAIFAGVKLLGASKPAEGGGGETIDSLGSIGAVIPMASVLKKIRGLESVTLTVPFTVSTTKGGSPVNWNYQLAILVANSVTGTTIVDKLVTFPSAAPGSYSHVFTIPIPSTAELGDHKVDVGLWAATNAGGAPTSIYSVALAQRTNLNVYEVILDPTLIANMGSIGAVLAARILM